MSHLRKLQALIVALSAAFAAFAAPNAFAQDYTTTMVNSTTTYQTPPGAGKTTVPLAGWTYTATTGSGAGAHVTLPFTFPFMGVEYTRVWVSSQGFIQFGVTGATGSLSVTNTTWPPSGTEDGMVAALWDDLNMDPGNPFGAGRGSVFHWTLGTAPNRTWIVSWEGVRHFNNASGNMSFQIQLSETTGRIFLAYAPDNGTWGNLSYSAGIDAVSASIDSRSYLGGVKMVGFFNPQATLVADSNIANHPLRDIQYDARQFTYTGTLRYDRLVADATGIHSGATNVPLAGLPVELRRGDGSLGFRTTLDANGSFSITATGLDRTKTGSIAVVAETPAAAVRATSTTAPLSYTFQTSVAFNAGLALGTRTVGATADANGAARSPLQIALTVKATSDWLATRIATAIPKIDIIYNAASSSPTSFRYVNSAGTIPAQIVIGSTGSSNEDGWDDWIVRREYGRHVLATLIGPTTNTVDTRLDAATSAENAFAEAFGIYLHTAMTGDTTLADGLTSTTANVFAVETPTLTTAKGPTVTGWVAAALYDLVDGGSNESWDGVDGAGTAADRPLLATAKMSPPATAESFITGWSRAGFDGFDLSRIWIYHRLSADDASEPNDSAAAAFNAGPLPFAKKSMVLSVFNEDWYEFQVTGAPTPVDADVSFDRVAIKAQVGLQILDTNGTVLATGLASTPTGPIHAVTGTLAPGTYRLRVRHVGGPAVPNYSVQAYLPVAFTSDQGGGWNVNVPFTATLRVSGGIPPYAIALDPASVVPDGLTFDANALTIKGTPTKVGTGKLSITMTDSGSPANVVTVGGAFSINPAFDLKPGPFTPFAMGRAHDRPLTIAGGTTPLVATLTGELPDGIRFDANTGRFVGTPTTVETTSFQLDATDRTGAPDTAESRAVVCLPFGAKAATATLGEGNNACGWYFDAVEGSSATVSVTTAKGSAARKLAVTIIGPSGAAIPGALAKGGTGRATVSKIKCSRSGRYFVVVSSTSGAAGQLLGTARVLPPTKGAKSVIGLAPNAVTVIRVPALPGAKLTLKATPDKPSKAKLDVFFVANAQGVQVNLETAVAIKRVGSAVQLDATLATGGTWTVGIICLPELAAKKVAWTFKVTQPKGVLFDADLGAGE